MPSLRRWHASHLLTTWVAYWALLLVGWLARPAFALWQLRDAPKDTASASLSFDNGGFVVKIVGHGRTIVDQHAAAGWVLFWLIVPPLLLSAVWLVSRPRPDAARPAELGAGDPFDDVRYRERPYVRHDTPR